MQMSLGKKMLVLGIFALGGLYVHVPLLKLQRTRELSISALSQLQLHVW